ncbi:RTA1-like protein [Auriscalpium vulgare]|uniref:RTA1-like protein n=1 Tax=Auriscalpium vulgare TaxID=40419 RepID=A0ACB8S8Q4_9AGAM|nr:RTA1-like protein [Auriscalpium vulgare]
MSIFPTPFRTAFAVLLVTVCLASLVRASDHGSDSIDLKDDLQNPLGYIASNTLTTVALAAILAVAFTHVWCMIKWGAIWMLCMVIGEFTFAGGIATRYVLHTNPDSANVYRAEYLLVILSPCAFIAADYILIGRLSRHLRSGKHLLISPRRITLVFVSSDILTFLVQAIGGGLSAGSNPDTAKLGSHIFLAGLILQLVSFIFFGIVYFVFIIRVRRHERDEWFSDADKPWYNDWRALAAGIAVNIVGITIRSFYRVAELSQGYRGSIAQDEKLFYLLDTLPLWIAVAMFVPFWPGRFISPLPKGGERGYADMQMKPTSAHIE